MIEPILSGIGFGLLLAAILGPVFFTLLQTSLHEGFKAASHLAFGVLLSDMGWIVAGYSLASQFTSDKGLPEKYKFIVGWVGGTLLIVFGVYNFFKKIKVKEVDDDKKTVHAKFVFKGFFLNAFNPSVPLFWLSVISVVKLKEEYSFTHEAVFFASVLTTVFGIDLLKSYVAQRIKALLNAKVLLWMNRILGLILFIIGARMMIKVM
jgi:threonine/homoserine/homoserine lactone efflux protein